MNLANLILFTISADSISADAMENILQTPVYNLAKLTDVLTTAILCAVLIIYLVMIFRKKKRDYTYRNKYH